MAAWHFEMAILPKKGIEKFYGAIPKILVEYQQMSLDADFDAMPSNNYWEGIDIFGEVLQEAKMILPDELSRFPDHLRIGSNEGDRFTIWNDELIFEFDLRDPDLEVLEAVLRFARKFDCIVVAGKQGHVIEPQMSPVLQAIKSSGAFRFVTNPQQWLKEIAEGDQE